MRRPTLVAAFGLVAVSTLPFAAARADHHDLARCAGGPFALFSHEFALPVGNSVDATKATRLYVDDRDLAVNGVWVYEESNGTDGLQRGGTSALPGDLGEARTDPCHESDDPDTLLF